MFKAQTVFTIGNSRMLIFRSSMALPKSKPWTFLPGQRRLGHTFRTGNSERGYSSTAELPFFNPVQDVRDENVEPQWIYSAIIIFIFSVNMNLFRFGDTTRKYTCYPRIYLRQPGTLLLRPLKYLSLFTTPLL